MSTEKIKSLIIDDDPFIRTLLMDLLETDFPNVTVMDISDNGIEGIAKIKALQPDLVFLDVELANMTGFEVLSHFEQPFFQTIFITSSNHYAVKALRLNALDYLVKPIDPLELKQALSKFQIKVLHKERNETIQRTVSDLEKLILNVFPKEIAAEIKKNGAAKTKHYDLVTILFADIKEFTQHAERMSPIELVEELNHYYSAFDLIMETNGVEKIKTIGDAYMAAGGVPIANTTNPLDTIKAALDINEFIIQAAEQRRDQGKNPFEFRIGIHSGPVVAGIVGIKKFAYDIWGDTVNVAARIEGNGSVGKINISQSTYEYLKEMENFNFIPRGNIQIKGKGKIRMFFVE